MFINKAAVLSICFFSLVGLSNMTMAEPAAFTRFADFLAATPTPVTTLNFDELRPGTTIAQATATGGITFSYDFDGIPMKVAHRYATTSQPNFLGTGDGEMFHDGDDFSMSFPAGHAIGLFFITADPVFDGDLTLTAGGTTASLATAHRDRILPDGSSVYFLGIVDREAAFTKADITAIAGGFFLFNVDDIVTAPRQRSSTTARVEYDRP